MYLIIYIHPNKIEYNVERDINEVENISNPIFHYVLQRIVYKRIINILIFVRTALSNLFMQIEVAQLKNAELDYNPLINELNDLLDHYRELINTRATINMRYAEDKHKDDSASAASTTLKKPIASD